VSRLRVLALNQDSPAQDSSARGRRVAVDVRDATNAVIAEVEAMNHAVLGAGQHEPGAETFLWVRVARLAQAADHAVDAARTGDFPALRAHVRHFDTLTSAICTVQNAI